jgi:hypothetical protein
LIFWFRVLQVAPAVIFWAAVEMLGVNEIKRPIDITKIGAFLARLSITV